MSATNTGLLPYAAPDDQPRLTPFPQARKDFRWGPTSLKVAVMLAEERMHEEIAAAVGVHRNTILNWLTHPQFTTRVNELQAVMCQQIVTRGAAQKVRRIEKLLNQLARIDKVIEERAEWFAQQEAKGEPAVPGSQSGLLVTSIKTHGHDTVYEYRFDAALSKERREVLKQIAVEKGEWTEKHDVTSGGKPFKVYLMDVADV